MRLVFSADEDDRYSADRDELLDSVAEWARRNGREGDSFALMAALDGKYDRDGRLDRWQSADLRALLLEWFPRKVALSTQESAGVLPTLHALVDFLEQRRWLNSDGAPVAELHATIDEHRQAFLDAMADERNYDIGKFWSVRMIEHGVDPEDQDSVQRFVSAVHSGEITVDQSLLDEIMQRRFSEAEPAPSGPELPEPGPVKLPSEPELIDSAQTSDLVVRLRTFAEWLGAGRTLTRTGRLTVAQGRELTELLDVDRSYLAKARSSAALPQVSLTVAWAKKAGIARTVKGKLIPVKKAAPLLDKPLELWRKAFDAFGELGADLCDSGGAYGVSSLLGYSFDEVLPVLWWGLYAGGESPLPEELLHLAVRDALVAAYGLTGDQAMSDAQQRLRRQDLAKMLDALETLGAVVRWDSTHPTEHAKIAELSGQDDPSTTLARLTPLGIWKINEMLRDQGFSAPVVGELATAEFDELRSRVVDTNPDIADAEIRSWVGHRGVEQAAAELAGYLEHSERPSQRLFALRALAETGEQGREAARGVRADGGVTGAVVAVWLVESEAADPSTLTAEEMLSGTVDRLLSLNEQGVLLDGLGDRSAAEQAGLVRRLGEAEHPDLLPLLDAIAEQHPEHEVAKEAKKTRMKAGSV